MASAELFVGIALFLLFAMILLERVLKLLHCTAVGGWQRATHGHLAVLAPNKIALSMPLQTKSLLLRFFTSACWNRQHVILCFHHYL